MYSILIHCGLGEITLIIQWKTAIMEITNFGTWGDFIMGLFGGKDKYNYDEEAKLHELEIQKREIQDQQYESLLREYKEIPGVTVEVNGPGFEKDIKYKMLLDKKEVVFVSSLRSRQLYDNVPEELTKIRMENKYIYQEYREEEKLMSSNDFIGEKDVKVEGVKFSLIRPNTDEQPIIVNIKDLTQKLNPIMEILENIHWRNFFNVIDIPEENFNVKVINGDKFLGNYKYIIMRKNDSLILTRASTSGWDGRYVTIVEINIKDVLYYKAEGALRYEQQLSGGGGMGINYGSAILGGLLFGQAGAVIGSRQNEEVKNIESRTIEHDTRLITLAIKVDGNSYQIGFDINSELAFDWLIPEKQYDYVIQKRREQYEKANQ